MNNTGIHHVSVLGSSARNNYWLLSEVLQIPMSIKTVNQEDHRMYHLFYGMDFEGVHTEYTFFEMSDNIKNFEGTNSIDRTYFLVSNLDALKFWEDRLNYFDVKNSGIEEYDSRHIIRFQDEDGQKMGLTYNPLLTFDSNKIVSISEVHFRVRKTALTGAYLTEKFGFKKVRDITFNNQDIEVFEFDNPLRQQIHVVWDNSRLSERMGIGGIHHIAFGVESLQDLELMDKGLNEKNMIKSKIKYREFINSLYFRDPNYLLFEVATPVVNQPEFIKEQTEFVNLPLYLPEFLEDKREEIENM